MSEESRSISIENDLKVVFATYMQKAGEPSARTVVQRGVCVQAIAVNDNRSGAEHTLLSVKYMDCEKEKIGNNIIEIPINAFEYLSESVSEVDLRARFKPRILASYQNRTDNFEGYDGP